MMEAVNEWKRLLHARKWMKQNASFLPAWHAYVGYSMDLFDAFADGATVEQIAEAQELDEELLSNWVDTGIVLGHLHEREGRIHADKEMLTYVSDSSTHSVGPLLREMMEMHIPTLLEFPRLMKGEHRPMFENERYGSTVAATSSLLERIAFPRVSNWVRLNRARSVLDIGCGHGGYLRRLSQKIRGLRLIGIEQNEDVVKQARTGLQSATGCKIEFVHGDFSRWEGPKEPVDLIMMNNILHYFHPDTRGLLFERARELLSDKGSVSLITPLYMSGSGQAFSAAFNSYMSAHDNLHGFPTDRELEETASAHGLVVKRRQPVIREGSWYFVGLQKR
ncbi:methyltransferase domain-containing protein [Paenibacillus sp. IB182496]|uniref:Methyltransferase domain-containing protein n=1 Tax=Paenibacillus sabuli TaxID=2772509 RepID=A0A927BPM2_9BACL|nr:class I SAM-dependent methyltransferase [Paenibacillus sabuli]MBD2844407.1 methyltransferase domain-containing protein [Paenibacillus sabuli]